VTASRFVNSATPTPCEVVRAVDRYAQRRWTQPCWASSLLSTAPRERLPGACEAPTHGEHMWRNIGERHRPRRLEERGVVAPSAAELEQASLRRRVGLREQPFEEGGLVRILARRGEQRPVGIENSDHAHYQRFRPGSAGVRSRRAIGGLRIRPASHAQPARARLESYTLKYYGAPAGACKSCSLGFRLNRAICSCTQGFEYGPARGPLFS